MKKLVEDRIIKKRLESYVVIDSNGCWIWQKNKSKSGYGKIKYKGRHFRAHRLSYEVYKQEIVGDLLIMHICDVRLCINPEHLRMGTQKENIQDAINKNRLPLGEERHNTLFTNEQVLEIQTLLRSGVKQPEIAKKFDVHPSIVSHINCGKTYSKITNTNGKIFQKKELSNGAKLIEKQVIEIKKALKSGKSHSTLARQYGVSRPTISQINRGKNWAHITID